MNLVATNINEKLLDSGSFKNERKGCRHLPNPFLLDHLGLSGISYVLYLAHRVIVGPGTLMLLTFEALQTSRHIDKRTRFEIRELQYESDCRSWLVQPTLHAHTTTLKSMEKRSVHMFD